MKIVPGSYVEIRFELSYMEGGERKIISATKKSLRKKVKDEKTGEEKEVVEIIDEPIVVKIGSGDAPKLIDGKIVEMDIDIGKKYEIEVPPEKAYGIRDPKNIERIPIKRFRKRIDEGILVLNRESRRPRSGDIVYLNVGGVAIYYGRVINVSDRDIIIDRNHPLAGKKIKVEFVVDSIVLPTDSKEERLKMILKKYFGKLADIIAFDFVSDDTIELRIDNTYFLRYPRMDRESAKRIIEEIYVPKLLFFSAESDLYSEFGVTRIRWIEEKEILKEIEEQGTTESSESASTDNEGSSEAKIEKSENEQR